MSNAQATQQPAITKLVKVCHFTSVHRVNDIRVYHKECVTLAAAGFDVTLIGVAADISDQSVKIVTLPDTGNRFERMVGRSRKVYQLAVDAAADIYHFHDPELLPLGLMLKRRTGAKVIFDSHECFREDVVAKDWIPAWLRPIVGHGVGAIEDFVVGRIDQVVAATPHIAKSFCGKADRIVTINNYPLANEFSGLDSQTKRARNAICYVGAISFVRGIIPFLNALSFIDETVVVHVAGIFANQYVEQAATKHPNWERVHFHGQVNREKIAEIYANSFAGIVTFLSAPNHINSQPNKLFEYMAAGIPVIGSHFPLWRTIIEDGNCGIVVDPDNPAEIGAAVEVLRTDPIGRCNMADQAVRLVQTKYNWDCEGRRLIESYYELIGN